MWRAVAQTSFCLLIFRMLLLAHTGIPLGLIWLSQKVLAYGPSKSGNQRPDSEATYDSELSRTTRSSAIRTLLNHVDFRLVILGSLLPDIIDKPLRWLLGDTIGTGRSFAHTLIFTMLLILSTIYFYVKHKPPFMLYVSFGVVMHLILDQMWLYQETLLWPLFGWRIEKTCGSWLQIVLSLPASVSHWTDTVLGLLTKEPEILISEILGGLILVALLFDLVHRHRLLAFIRSGQR